MYEFLTIARRISAPLYDCCDAPGLCGSLAEWTVKIREDNPTRYTEWNLCAAHARSQVDDFVKLNVK